MTETTTASSVQTFTIVRNDKTSYYEVHKEGCAHIMAAHISVMHHSQSELSGDEFAEYLAQPENGGYDLAHTAGPCVKRGKRPVYYVGD